MKLSPVATPFILPYVQMRRDGTSLLIDTVCMNLELRDAHADRTDALLQRVDGRSEVAALAGALGWTSEAGCAVAGDLFRFGVIADASHAVVDAPGFYQHIVNRGRALRAQMATSSNLLNLSGRGPSKRLLLGSLVETYHFVRSASYHLSEALAHAPTAHSRSVLSHLLAEEMDHALELEEGLVHAGIERGAIRVSEPLPETLGVINFFRTLATTDLLAYLVCVGINESPRSNKQIKKDWDAITALGLLPREAIEPFRGHEAEDEARDHSSIPIAIFEEEGTISAPRQHRMIGVLLSFIETQASCYRGINRFYSTDGGPPLFSLR